MSTPIRARFLSILHQALLQVSLVLLLVWAFLSVSSCARRDTQPPGQASEFQLPMSDDLAEWNDELKETNLDRVQFLKRILKDPKLLAIRREFQKETQSTCAPFSPGQIQWKCQNAQATECRFVLETVCVGHEKPALKPAQNHSQTSHARTLLQLQINGQGSWVNQGYQLSPTARISKPVTVNFVQEKSR
jgi:hypothetical protein